jgi:hypothetical protein
VHQLHSLQIAEVFVGYAVYACRVGCLLASIFPERKATRQSQELTPLFRSSFPIAKGLPELQRWHLSAW